MEKTSVGRSVLLRFSSAKWLVLMMMAWSAGCGRGGSKQKSAPAIESTQQAVTGAFCAGVTADFCDDFQDGNATSPAWTVRDQAVASDFTVVTDGDYVYKQGNSGTTNTRRISTAGAGWGHVIVEAKIKVLSFKSNTANWVGLYARYNTSSNTGYAFALGGDGKVSLRKKTTGSDGTCISATYPASGCAQTVSPAIALNTWYTLKFVLNGSTLTGYLNGTRVIEGTDTAYTTGVIGVGSTGGSTFEADEVAVNRLMGTCDAGFGVPKAAGTVCRAANGTCDQAETCDGTNLACPADTFQASGTVCRAAAGACDKAETCSGTSAACPADTFQASGTVCRAAAGACDKAETCSGTSASCPADALLPSSTVCRASAGACDVAENCTGTSAACPADAFLPSSTVCRAANGVCDKAENCTGTSAACPADSFQPSGTVCRAATGDCDKAETCTGTSTACPADGLQPSGTICRAASGPCDAPETCTGSSTTCPAEVETCSSTCWAFCDNFESGNSSKWTVKQGNASDFSVVTDSTKVYKEGAATASTWHVSQAGKVWLSQTVEAKLKPLSFASSSAYVALFGRYEVTSAGDCAYYAALRGDGKVALGKRLNGADSVLGTPVASGIATGTWYAVKLDMQGSTIDVYLNGSKILTQTDSTCEVGSVGVASLGASFESDDVRVTAPTTNACVQGWRNNACGDYCKGQTQSDKIHCADFLDCYAQNSCSPESCGGQDDVCGVNHSGLNSWGMAPKVVADQVYKCMGCAGSVNCGSAKKPDSTACADGNACTTYDSCQGGVCVGAGPVTCYAKDQCHNVGTCNPSTGTCSDPNKTDGTTCNDGNACTATDVCTAGTCGGNAYSCDDGMACTADSCNGDGTCTHILAAGSCAINGACYVDGAVNPDNQCQQCTPSTSQTAWSPRPAGTACNDGNPCTANDVCNGASACIGTPYTCNDGLACTADTCNGDGTCSFALLPGNCAIAGVCYTDGTPSPTNQCQQCASSASGTSWSPKANGAACNDGNACTQTDTCVAGSCTGSNPMQCTARDQCHAVGTCDVGTGACSNPAKPDGTTCDDGNAQTQADTCTMGMCQGTITCDSVGGIFAGEAHTCAIRTDKSLWCWGLNNDGQIGNGSSDNSLAPVRVGMSTWSWNYATAGGSHSCAVRSDGTLWCWGLNDSGQLGGSTAPYVSTPAQAAGQNWTTVAGGSEFTCGLQSDGTLWCWGANSYADLASPQPVQLAGTNWASVVAGYYHACGIQSDHTLWCWGLNSDGELGNNGGPKSAVPLQVGAAEWSIVTAGSSHTCGVKLDGSLWCWGGNVAGQRGTGPGSSSAIPAKVGSATWTGIAAGGEHTCGIQVDGTLWCWGRNDTGELGVGLTGNQPFPVRVLGQAWTGITAGTHHSCGKRQDGSLWCWGQNTEGAVGDGTGEERDAPKQVVGSWCSQVPICGNSQVEQGEQCDDGNTVSGDGCSMDCQIEKCFGVVCNASDDCHGVGVCDAGTGACSSPVLPDGTPCDDHNLCTSNDKCSGGQCGDVTPVTCPATDACHQTGVCDPETGACINGQPITCDDNNPCTDDLCLPSSGCQYSANSAKIGQVCSRDGCQANICNDAGTCSPDPLHTSCLSGQVPGTGFSTGSGYTSPALPQSTAVTANGDGSFLAYYSYQFGDVNRFAAKIATRRGGDHVEVHLDTLDGPLIADLATIATLPADENDDPTVDDPTSYQRETAPLLSVPSGPHDVYLVFKQGAAGPWTGTTPWIRIATIEFYKGHVNVDMPYVPLQSIADDPVLKGSPIASEADWGNVSAGREDEDLPDNAHWHAFKNATVIQPSQTASSLLRVRYSVVVSVTLTWTGGPGPLDFGIYDEQNNLLAAGVPRMGRLRGTVGARTLPVSLERVVLKATNNGNTPLTVNAILGVWPNETTPSP